MCGGRQEVQFTSVRVCKSVAWIEGANMTRWVGERPGVDQEGCMGILCNTGRIECMRLQCA